MVFTGPFAELYVYPRLVDSGDIERTAQNIVTHRGLFAAGILGYMTMLVCDVVVAWALYVLLSPVNRHLSLLAAWFRVVYAVIGLLSVTKLVTVLRILGSSDDLTVSASDSLLAQVRLLLKSFEYEWQMGFAIFGLYLMMLGYLVFRSGYIPKILGMLLAIAGLGWLADSLRPLLYPGVDTGFVMIVSSVGELIFVFWLLLRGGTIQEPARQS